MSVFAIGDLHLSLGAAKPMDIFQGWDNYARRLEDHWRATVGPEDTVVVVGDLSWAMDLEGASLDFAFLHSLPGRKIVLKGNHDYWWTTMRKMGNWLRDHGFDSIKILFNNAFIAEGLGICGTRSWFYDDGEPADAKIFARELGRLRASLAALDRVACADAAVFLHYPPVYRGNIVREVIDVIREFDIKRCYYGHLHGPSIPNAFNDTYEGIAFQLVSADYLKFAPLKIVN